MRLFLILPVLLGACVCPSPLGTEESEPAPPEVTTLPAQMETSVSVIGDGDGAVVFVAVRADEAVGIDPDRPAQLRIGERWVEAPAADAPTARRVGDRMTTSASYRVGPESARWFARGGDVTMQLSVDGMWHTVTATRADMLE